MLFFHFPINVLHEHNRALWRARNILDRRKIMQDAPIPKVKNEIWEMNSLTHLSRYHETGSCLDPTLRSKARDSRSDLVPNPHGQKRILIRKSGYHRRRKIERKVERRENVSNYLFQPTKWRK